MQRGWKEEAFFVDQVLAGVVVLRLGSDASRAA